MGSITKVVIGSSEQQDEVAVDATRVTPGLDTLASKLHARYTVLADSDTVDIFDEPVAMAETPDPAPTKDPSTYYQVLKNMNAIHDLSLRIEDVQNALDEKSDELGEEGADIRLTIVNLSNKIDNLIDAISIKTDAMEENTNPSAYEHRITHEIKVAYAVGLGPINGLTGSEQVYIQTVRLNDLDGVTLSTFQKATINGEISYARHATTSDGWEPWVTVSGGSGSDVIYSQAQPSAGAQKEGGLWLTNIG